jgi:two-component system sensor histidine kinase UhpB
LRQSPANQNLAEAIRICTGDTRWASILNIHTHIDPIGALALDADSNQQVLSILNEALSNAARHAHARQVVVSAHIEDQRLWMSIQDDGRGFQNRQDGKGYGLRNMHDRARLLGGTLTIDSKPGKGTTIRLDVPLEVQK